MAAPRPPVRYPLFDLAGATSGLLPSVYQTSGIPPGSLGNSADMGALLRSTGLWTAYADCKGLRNADWVQSGTSDPVRLSSDRWAYPLASGLASLSPTGVPVFLYQGERLEVDFQITQPDPQIRPGSAATSPISFAASKVTWVYMSAEGVVLLDVLPVASPANPPAGYFPAVGVTTDGFNVVSHDYTGTPERLLTVDAIPLAFTFSPVFAGGFTCNGPAIFTSTLDAQAGATISGAILDAQAGAEVSGALLEAKAGLLVSGGTAEVAGLLNAKGAATLGTTAADAINVNGTSTFNENATVAAGKLLSTRRLQFVADAAPVNNLELTAAATGELIYKPTGSLVFVHYSASGFAYAVGTQETSTGLLTTHSVPLTNARVKPQSGQVRVIVKGWGQRAVLGLVTLQIEQDDGAFVWSSAGTALQVEWLGNGNANLWSPFFSERTLNPGTVISRFYRVKITALGAGTCQIRESSIEVKPAQT